MRGHFFEKLGEKASEKGQNEPVLDPRGVGAGLHSVLLRQPEYMSTGEVNEAALRAAWAGSRAQSGGDDDEEDAAMIAELERKEVSTVCVHVGACQWVCVCMRVCMWVGVVCLHSKEGGQNLCWSRCGE